MPADERSGGRKRLVIAALWLGYVCLAHGLDVWLTRRHGWYVGGVSLRLANGFNLYEFAAWFVIPLLLSLPGLEAGYFTFARWRRADYALLGMVAVAAGVVWAALLWWPSVSAYYGGARAPMSWYLWWNASWLVGWEFLHRYVLTRTLLRTGIAGLWLLVPMVEAGHHALAHKPWPEVAGMLLFSLAATSWTVWRRNAVLPFIAHAAIEATLVAYLFTR